MKEKTEDLELSYDFSILNCIEDFYFKIFGFFFWENEDYLLPVL